MLTPKKYSLTWAKDMRERKKKLAMHMFWFKRVCDADEKMDFFMVLLVLFGMFSILNYFLSLQV